MVPAVGTLRGDFERRITRRTLCVATYNRTHVAFLRNGRLDFDKGCLVADIEIVGFKESLDFVKDHAGFG